jgi:Zn-dependent peptidase ImmA (M78 family)
MAPGSAVLLRLASALDVNVEYFLRPVSVGEIRPVYRKTSLGIKQLRSLEEEIRDWLERYLQAEAVAPVPSKTFDYPASFPRAVHDVYDPEEAAEVLRREWIVGVDPIENISQLLEDKGIRVGEIDAPDGFDACAFFADGSDKKPVIVGRCNGIPGDRQRFSYAHELGHILLDVDDTVNEELACHRFAGAFLVPRVSFLSDIGDRRNDLSISELFLLKQKWGVSMQVLIYRAKHLDVISDFRFRSLLRLFRKRGWHRCEPDPQIPREHPERFDLMVYQSLAEGIIGLGRAKELLGHPVCGR